MANEMWLRGYSNALMDDDDVSVDNKIVRGDDGEGWWWCGDDDC